MISTKLSLCEFPSRLLLSVATGYEWLPRTSASYDLSSRPIGLKASPLRSTGSLVGCAALVHFRVWSVIYPVFEQVLLITNNFPEMLRRCGPGYGPMHCFDHESKINDWNWWYKPSHIQGHHYDPLLYNRQMLRSRLGFSLWSLYRRIISPGRQWARSRSHVLLMMRWKNSHTLGGTDVKEYNKHARRCDSDVNGRTTIYYVQFVQLDDNPCVES